MANTPNFSSTGNPASGTSGSHSQTGNQGQSGQRGKESGFNVTETAKQAASTVSEAASGAASYVGHKADDATAAVGSGIKSVAGTIRDYGPQRDTMGRATNAVADSIEDAGRYLEQHGLSGIADDMTSLVRRNPIPSLFIAMGVGFLLARSMSSRSY
jgi:hypothetical protein